MIKYYTPGLEKLLIIGALCVVSYILWKKFFKKDSLNRSEIKIISMLPLGQKEKLVVCEIQNKKFIMGVTQHNISHLHTFEPSRVNTREPELPKNSYTPYFT